MSTGTDAETSSGTGIETGELESGGCATNQDCAETEICDFSGTCDAAWGHTYRVTIVSVDIESMMPGGGDWDASGGAPDPYWAAWLDGTNVYTSPVESDVFSATWFDGFDVLLSQSVELQIDLWDYDDVSDHDALGTIHWNGVPPALLHRGGGTYISGSVSVSMTVDLVQ